MSSKILEKSTRARSIDLSGAHLPATDLSDSDLSNTNFSNANLVGANFKGSILRHAKFVRAKLRKANLTGTDVSFADFSKADLSKADLTGAKCDGTNFDLATLTQASVAGADLRTAKNLSWYSLLSTRVTRETLIPEYLKEDELFEFLNSLNPHFDWREAFSGRIQELFQRADEILQKLGPENAFAPHTMTELFAEFRRVQEQKSEE